MVYMCTKFEDFSFSQSTDTTEEKVCVRADGVWWAAFWTLIV